MRSEKLTGKQPAQRIIEQLGGPTVAADLAGVHRTRAYGWLKTGTIPLKHIPKLVAAANEKGVHLSVEDFMPEAA